MTSPPPGDAAPRRVTFECAGNGRARLSPAGQPDLRRWVLPTGPESLAAVLREAGPPERWTFTGADHGIERGVEQTTRAACAWPTR